MLYLIRHSETGRESQPARRKQQRDIVGVLRAHLPDARFRTDTGRIFLETADDTAAAAVLAADVHGVTSFSRCRSCKLADLEPCVLAYAVELLAGKRSFAVRVKRVGAHRFTSAHKAAQLGRLIHARLPHLEIDLEAPEALLRVEIRDDDCYLFDAVIPGRDRRTDLAAPAPSEPRFLADQMLGRLAAWLRLLGFDTAHVLDQADSLLLRKSRQEGRILLTRDRALAAVRTASVFFVSSRELTSQLREVLAAFRLRVERDQMFTRCTACNHPVEAVAKERVRDKLPPVAYRLYDRFTWCRGCDKLYWQGGHYGRILGALEQLVGD